MYILGDMATYLADWTWDGQAIVRLAMASVLGAVIGAEREHHGRTAGLRTQLLVGMGSALAMIVSLHFGEVYGRNAAALSGIRIDPARVAYGVMGGIGFLGAGAILRYGAGVRGVTTAASLWCTAAVGLACGFGMFAVATACTVIVIFALTVLSKLAGTIPAVQYRTVTVTLQASERDNVERFRGMLIDRGVRPVGVQYVRDRRDNTETITLHVRMPGRRKQPDLTGFAGDVNELLCLKIE